MDKLSALISDNAKTFYNYRTGSNVSVAPRYAALIIISAVLSLFFNKPSSELYSAFIAAQAILIGFSFNVLVYLASADLLIAKNTSVLEDESKVEKLNRLSGEIVTNLSYFNLVALLSVVLSLLVLGGRAYGGGEFIVDIGLLEQTIQPPAWLAIIADAFRLVVVWVAYATVLDSLATFFRVTRRVTYFFTEKRKLAARNLG